MARSEIDTEFNTFVGGILTEANPINYPVGYTLDEENFILERDGTRRRRFGTVLDTTKQSFDSKAATEFSSIINFTSATYRDFYIWRDAFIEGVRQDCLVVIYDILATGWVSDDDIDCGLLFYRLTDSSDITGNFITSYTPAPTVGSYVGDGVVQSISGYRSGLIINQKTPSLNAPTTTRSIIWDATLNSFTSVESSIQARDTIGVQPSNVTSRPSTLSDEHAYNLYNAGWDKVSVDGWKAFDNTYPSLSDHIVFYKNKGTAFSVAFMQNSFPGSSRSPTGRTITSAFTVNLNDYSFGVNSIKGSSPSGDPDGVTFTNYNRGGIVDVVEYGGRVFNLCRASRVTSLGTTFLAYSQNSADPRSIYNCHSVNDATSEVLNAPLDTDGGIIDISESGDAVRILASRSKLLVFGSRGIYQVHSRDNVFKPSDLSIRKVSSNILSYNKETINPYNPQTLYSFDKLIGNSVITYKDSFILWTPEGILSLQHDPQSDSFVENNLTNNTIDTLYQGIPNICKAYASGTYLPADNCAMWTYSLDESNPDKHQYALVYDLVLNAWYKFKFFNSANSYIEGVFNGSIENTSRSIDRFKDLIFIANTTSGRLPMTFTESTFKDFEGSTEDTEVQAFMQTGYLNANDSARQKQSSYIIPSFIRTETGFVDDGSGNLTPVNESSCLISAWWDYVDDSSFPKANDTFEAYRYNRLYIPSGPSDIFDYGQSVITTKNRLTGRGRALSLRFETTEGKDCRLLGWNLGFGANSKV